MAKPKVHGVYPRELNTVFRNTGVTVKCPKCGEEGALRIHVGGYLVVRHWHGATHMVPADQEAKVLKSVVDSLVSFKKVLDDAIATIQGVVDKAAQEAGHD
jgi:hypothetical protein